MGFRVNSILFFSHFAFCLAAFSQSTQTNPAIPVRATAATNAVESFQLKKGFRIELVAAEPLVLSPVAMAFDENGRLFVAEMRDYPNRRNENPHLGRVRLLEDSDGDRTFDTATVFADNLPLPSAIACYDGGLFVCAMPEVLYLKDTNGDGVADVRQAVLTGLGTQTNPNPDALVHNFNWGLDNRIHAATGASGGVATPVNGTGVSVLGRDFAFDPRSMVVMVENGDGHRGLTFDNSGRRYTCTATEPARLPVFEWRYAVRNPFFDFPSPTIDLARSPVPILPFSSEAAEVTNRLAAVRTNAARVPAEVKLGPTQSFRAASGCVIYRGSAFPSNYVGHLFVAEPTANLIQHLVVNDGGLAAVVQRATDEVALEFLVSRDKWFRPVQIVNGPDGCLYMADMYRQSFLPEETSDEQRPRLNVSGGTERGRIWRIVPQDYKILAAPRLGKASTYDLVSTLAHPNGWHRDTAARLLYERQDKASIGLLTNMLNNSRSPLARLHALHALDGLNALTESLIAKSLRDADEHVREHAVLLSEKLVRNGTVSGSFWMQLTSLAADSSLRVRYQLALTLGEIQHQGKGRVLADLVRRDIGVTWMRAAVLSSVAQGSGDLFESLASDARFRNGQASQEFLRELAVMIGTQHEPAEVNRVIDFIVRARLEPGNSFGLLADLGEGLARAGNTLPQADGRNRIGPFYQASLDTALATDAARLLRAEALRLLRYGAYSIADIGDVLSLLVDPGESEAVRSAAIETLMRLNASRAAAILFQRWGALTPASRDLALNLLLARRENAAVLVAAIEAGTIPRGDLSSTQMNFLRTYPDPLVAQRAVQLFGQAEPPRTEVLAEFARALKTIGSAGNGRQIFQNRCADCHELTTSRPMPGPQLAKARSAGRQKLLEDILDPGKTVRADYTTWVLQSKAGENLVGVLADPNGVHAILRQSDGNSAVVPRDQIANLTSRTWSLMPTDAAQGLSVQQMADLIEYLMTAK